MADAPWNDEEMLAQVRREVLPAMQKHDPVVAWIIDDTAFPKQGKYSVGVARQYCGELGKSYNCQAAVSLSVSTWNSSLPVAWRLCLPEVWGQDAQRRRGGNEQHNQVHQPSLVRIADGGQLHRGDLSLLREVAAACRALSHFRDRNQIS